MKHTDKLFSYIESRLQASQVTYPWQLRAGQAEDHIDLEVLVDLPGNLPGNLYQDGEGEPVINPDYLRLHIQFDYRALADQDSDSDLIYRLGPLAGQAGFQYGQIDIYLEAVSLLVSQARVQVHDLMNGQGYGLELAWPSHFVNQSLTSRQAIGRYDDRLILEDED
ncbi:hypothetical protein AWM75_00215 [Aerococcus urinaehominis]|uniref:Uncharacterized protein n=1 Tax=Aerococcus urinaehominis TaxID=128944 RepID=A0A0X8FJJ8_9LACT|nr:hypothetical protein [Aerococcus urinaehominis]AMB98508.1 hypothetical protein AWM75_00215 [Aerococcus urinaehominis]SDL80237.1 hypothetical protein SAMN04487985_101104 [Aerococcus urinaehominis]